MVDKTDERKNSVLRYHFFILVIVNTAQRCAMHFCDIGRDKMSSFV